MIPDLKDQKFCIFGLQGSGKTYLAKHILENEFKKPMIYVVHNEDFKDTRAARWNPPKDRDGLLVGGKMLEEDFNLFIRQAIKFGKQKKIDLVVIDEADMFFQWNYNISGVMNDLVLNHRHYNLSVCFISRRPQDIPTKIVESSKALFVFSLEGDNAYKKLRNINPELEEKVKTLKHKDYHFVVKEVGKAPEIHKPIK